MSKQIIVADDHPLFRSAISHLLQRLFRDIEIIEVDCFQHLQDSLEQQSTLPSLVILDLKLPDIQGLDGLLTLKKQYSELPVVIISAYDEEKVIQQTKHYGASGFISKSVEMDGIAQAISSILEGDLHFPQLDNSTQAQPSGIEQLTPTQVNVLKLLTEGKASKAMANEMGVTEATIKAHLTTIFKKLGVRNRTQAVIVANQMNLNATL